MSSVNTNVQLLSSPGPKVTGGAMDVLTALGQQLEITPELLADNPELAKLLGENPENLDFKTLLGDSAESLEGKIDPKLLEEAMKDQALTGKTEGNLLQVKNPELGNLKNPLVSEELNPAKEALGKSNPSKSILIKPEQLEQGSLKAGHNSKEFIPERTSMFKTPEILKSQATSKNATEPKPTKGLMDLNDFIANQSQSQKGSIGKNPYKSQMSDSMFAKKIEADAPKLSTSSSETPMKVTDLMLMDDSQMGQDSGSEFLGQKAPTTIAATGATAAAAKTFDMGQLTSSNQADIIGQIQDYILQSKVSSEPTVQMSFDHKDLGMVDLTVSKGQNNHISVMINSHTAEGSKFFTQHQTELLQSLTQSGVQVSEFKLDTSSNTNQNNNNQNQSSSGGNQKEQSAGNDKQQRNEDSRRREELWNLFNNKDAA